MAKAIYPQYLLWQLQQLASANLKMMLVSITTGPAGNNYVYDGATDQFLSAIPVGAVVAPGVALTNKVAALQGDVAGLTWDPVIYAGINAPNGANIGQKGEAAVIYIDTGDWATSRVVGFVDSGSNLPVSPNGLTFTVTPANPEITFGPGA